ncbi:protein lava lamp-like [Anopheles maculipalpis]|uniref:protein lava lamp-like n=1 Tax=Anopheles maculipalpis TaxID=1496333 RepID=UPI002158B306|nr:protein lava lamp-like [Anopheles maculipalpis]
MAGNSNQDDPELANLQSSFDEQQAKISALREIIRQTEVVNDMKHATAQEKVKNIAQRLTHFKTKVTNSRLNRASSISSSSQSLATIDQGVPLKGTTAEGRPDPRSPLFPRGRSESSGMEKCSLLRQQIEQNRLKMAERESSQREIEEKVIEIKHKLEATQQTLGRSGELDRSSTTCLPELVPPYELADGLRRSVSHSFLDSGPSHESRSTPVQAVRDSEEQFNDELTQFEDSVRQARTKRKSDEMLERRITTLEDDLHEKERIIDEQLRALSLLVKGLLEEDNKSDLELVKELHNLQMKLLQQSYSISNDEAISRLLESYGYDPLEKAVERKKTRSDPTPEAQLETDDARAAQLRDAMEKIVSLEQALASQDLEMERLNQQMADLRQSLEEKSIELNVMTANVSVLQEKLKTSGPKPLFPRSADEELESETSKLKQQLDESNKNMIKCKLKIKQLQKQVDTLKQTSNVHEEIAKLTEENTVLAQRLAEVEERHTGDGTSDRTSATKQAIPELQKRIEMLELTCQHQATAMQLLEEQKNDLNEDLNRTRHELQSLADHPGTVPIVAEGDGDGDNGRIASQMLSIELEEKLEKCLADKSELTMELHSWEAEKVELQQKLNRYASENAELLGRIDKLSLEKVSSAESIEILENLTQREKQEMENSEKRTNAEESGGSGETLEETDENVPSAPGSKEDLNESLLKLMDESKELMDKVELFTDERREVFEKLDAISMENQAYLSELDKLKEANEQLRTYSGELASAKSDLEDRLRIINEEKEIIRLELDTVRVRRTEGEECSTGAASLPIADEAFDQEAYQQSLLAVETDITNYNKNKDKQKKMQLAKKLTLSAKSVVTMSRQLLDGYSRHLEERSDDRDRSGIISTLETKLQETVKCLESKASQTALLQEEIAMLKHELEVACEKSSDDEPELLKVELNSKNDEILLLKKDIDALVDAKSSELLQIQHRLLEVQQENHHLKTYSAELQYRLEQQTEAHNQQLERLQAEAASESLESELQHKQETIETLNGQIIDLYRTVEEHQLQVDELRTQKEQVEHKNEELLEKLKKFAANLKKKNVQFAELEKSMEALKESSRKVQQDLENRIKEFESNPPTDNGGELREENEQMAQKLYHLNNELHRLLEQKYHMESEGESHREELQKCHEQLTSLRAELQCKVDALQSLELELQTCRDEIQTLQADVASKNGKIEKCKAIIKEKIKEAQRLQERERRAAYLEDELRMTQSKLEDFHNQTLLLGRLKSEKEELNATVRAEHEQRKTLEEQLTMLKDRDVSVKEQLKYAEQWIQRYCEKWRKRPDQSISLKSLEDLSMDLPTSDAFSWLTLLAETDQCITQLLVRQMEVVSTLENSLQNAEKHTKSADSEVEHLQNQLQSITTELNQYSEFCMKKDSQIEELKKILNTTQKELQQAAAESTQRLESQKSELTATVGEIERLKMELDEVRSSVDTLLRTVQERERTIETLNQQLSTLQNQLQEALTNQEQLQGSQQSELADLRRLLQHANEERSTIEQRLNEANQANAELSEEISSLRDNAVALDRELAEERQNITALTTAHQTLHSTIASLQESLSTVREDKQSLEEKMAEYEMIRVELVQEKQQKEQLNELLKQRDQEIQQLRELQDDAGQHQSMELNQLKQQLYEAEQVRAGWESTLNQYRTQNEEQTHELATLREKLASLERQTQEDQTNISILTSLNGALNDDLDLLQQQTGETEQRYHSLLDELNQSKMALEAAELQQRTLQQQTELADERYRTLQDEFEQQKLALESAEMSLMQQGTEKQQLSGTLQSKQQECEKLHQECEQLQRSLAEAKSTATAVVVEQQPDPKPKPEYDLGMWDDADAGWGTAETARLEELVREKDGQIQQLEAEKEMMQQEITDLKVKSGKLLRKVKECKVKLDATQRTEPDGSVQAQEALEAKVRELQREKAAQEQKLDTLESACEKLTEVKEFQDRQIELLRESANASKEVDELRAKIQQVTATLQTRESEIEHLKARLEQVNGEVQCVEVLRAELSEVQRHNAQLQSTASARDLPSHGDSAHSLELQLAELEHQNRLLEEEKSEMNRELEMLNQQILHDLQFEDRLNKALLELDAKGVEIQMLRSTVDQLQQGPAPEGSVVEVSNEAPPDLLAPLKTRIQELEQERTELLEKLSAGSSAQSQPIARVDDATVQEVLERQELEIVTLKEQLALRSAEYARLAARVDPTKLFASGLSGSETIPKPEQPPAGDRVPQAELELALYMIYQRDMRCDELELELRNLLQERDTLQLRLSNALRMHEEFKMRFAGTIPAENEYGTSGECSIDASPDRSLTGLPADERPVSSLSSPQDLTSKLSELQSISYSKEKRWQEEREERNRQLTLIQRDLANMPVEAAAKIAGTDVTADTEATTQQSASTVLLNWILGKK